MPSTCSTAMVSLWRMLEPTNISACYCQQIYPGLSTLCTNVRKLLGLIYRCFNHFSTLESLFHMHILLPIWSMPVKYGALIRLGKSTPSNASKSLHYVCVLKAGRVATTSYCSISLYQISSNAGFIST